VDEVGRGPLAGPVVVCACMPDPKLYPLLGSLNDSKKLSPKKREELFAVLTSGAGAKYALAMASPADIDSINILRATLRSMREAVLKLAPPAESLVLVDGNQKIPELPLRQMTLVKGDGRSLCIAAASVIAKVTRDRMMVEMDSRYPGYGFANHKGYGTAEHYAALEKLGPCPEHRRSFLPLWHNTTR
jgi:ribonuclease HII